MQTYPYCSPWWVIIKKKKKKGPSISKKDSVNSFCYSVSFPANCFSYFASDFVWDQGDLSGPFQMEMLLVQLGWEKGDRNLIDLTAIS